MTYYTPLIMLVWLTLIVLSLLTKENDRFTKEEKHVLYVTYLIVAAAAFAEWQGVRLNGNPRTTQVALRFVKFLDYVLTPIAGGAIVAQLQTKSIWRKLLVLTLTVNTLYQVVSLFTGWMITIDDGKHYVHGPGYFVYVLLYLIVVALVAVEFAVYGKKFRKQNVVSLYAIVIFVVIGVAMQELLGGEVRTVYVSLAIGLAMLFIHNSEYEQLESDDQIQEQVVRISIDPLTNVSSRHAYTEKIQALSEKPALPEDFVVFSIDINGLKTVNDTIGHHAGDELIRGAADCITSVFEMHGTSYRTGGDEFIVFADVTKDMIPCLKERLARAVQNWHGEEVASLSLSVGSAEANENPDLPLEKLIALADREMYQDKSNYYRTHGIDRRRG